VPCADYKNVESRYFEREAQSEAEETKRITRERLHQGAGRKFHGVG